MKATANIIINQPSEKVFEFVANIENMDQWVTGVAEPKWVIPGQTFTSDYHYGGKVHRIDYRVVDVQPQRRFATESTAGPFPYKGLIELQAQGNQTHLSNTIEAGSDGWFTSLTFTLLGPLLRRLMSKQILKELETLKQQLEG